MKTLLDKSVRDAMPRSHKLMLLSIVVFAVSQFLPWGDGSATATGIIGGVLDFTGGGYLNGTGWELHPQVGIVLIILLAVYLADPDENIPLFKNVGWWVTPIILLTQSQGGATIGAYLGLAALIGSVVAAVLHFIEIRRTGAAASK
jgi:hypothetical protein